MGDAFRKSAGLNASEQRLTALGEATFLRLWSYANVHVGRNRKGKIIGKELADLLVVCGEHVIVFSDKHISWPATNDENLNWCRWYRKSVHESAEQLRKAARWIKEFPDSLYLDSKCTQKLPVDLPDLSIVKVHGVLIASGASEACRNHYNGGSGSLSISSDLRDDEHTKIEDNHTRPFCIGDVNSSGPFLHVFNQTNIELLVHELNTITDFVEYLSSREKLLRSRHTVYAAGEEDLLSFYLQTEDEIGNHDFIRNNANEITRYDSIAIEEGFWRSYVARPEYVAKKKEEEQSYIWDRIIDKFALHVLQGTAPAIRGQTPEVRLAERALRIMALESRVHRRGLSQALVAAMLNSIDNKAARFARFMFSDLNEHAASQAYIFLILAYDTGVNSCSDYEDYRHSRIGLLEAYCFGLLLKYPNLKVVVGLAFDADESVTGRKGGSEDLMAVEQSDWTDDDKRRIQAIVDGLEILHESRQTRGVISTVEYPQIMPKYANRQQRRAAERALKKAQKRSR